MLCALNTNYNTVRLPTVGFACHSDCYIRVWNGGGGGGGGSGNLDPELRAIFP